MTPLAKLADECGTDKGSHQGFMPHYERYLPPDRGITLCELGVYRGESMKMWAKHFQHPNTHIMGIDIDLSNVDPAEMKPLGVELYKADQADANVAYLLTACRPLDVVVDDASHYSSKTIASFRTWWPYLVPGGLYVVEDTHCSYDTDYYGFKEACPPRPLKTDHHSWPVTTMEFLKRLADDVNWNYHGYNRFQPLYEDVAFVHFYPGIAFIGKKEA